MPLTQVTITGADDDVDPNALARLSYEFPFVEWGILFSDTRQGLARYPSHDWILRAEDFARHNDVFRLSAHLCGQRARDVASGSVMRAPGHLPIWRRVQINGATPSFDFAAHAGAPRWRRDVEWIIQARDDDAIAAAARLHAILPNVSALFDASGGRGIEPERWPAAPAGLRLGYAGGITPSSVEDVITAIGEQSHDFWIDMESGVRDSMDRFDLGLVRQALDAAAGHVKREPPRAQIIDLGEALKRSMEKR